MEPRSWSKNWPRMWKMRRCVLIDVQHVKLTRFWHREVRRERKTVWQGLFLDWLLISAYLVLLGKKTAVYSVLFDVFRR